MSKVKEQEAMSEETMPLALRDQAAMLRSQGIPVLSDLVDAGKVPHRKRPWGPERFVNSWMVILTDTITYETIPSPFDKSKMVEAVRMIVVDPMTGEEGTFTAMSLAILSHLHDQVDEYKSIIGPRLAVYVTAEPHKSIKDAQVYAFE